MRRACWTGVLALLLVLVARSPLLAQEGNAASLESFVERVTRLWGSGDAGGLARLAPTDGEVLLDVGEGRAGVVRGRHAAAALRALFEGRESVSVRPNRVALSDGDPAHGFGEIAWVFRSRGVSDPQNVILYVGAVRDGAEWRIRELRILR